MRLQIARRASRADIAVWLLIAAMPALFALSTWDGVGDRSALQDYVRFFSLPIVLIELVVILFALRCGLRPLQAVLDAPRWAQGALALLVLIAFGTAFMVAPLREMALIRTATSAIHLLFGLSLVQLMARRWGDLRDLIWPSIVIGLCVFAALFALFCALVPDPDRFDWFRFGFAGINIRQTGFYCAVGAAASLGLAATTGDRRLYWAYVLAAALFVAISCWTGTRGALIAILAAFVIGVALLPPLRSTRAWGALAASAAIGYPLSLFPTPPDPRFGLWRMVSSTSTTEIDALSSGRLTIWQNTIDAFLTRPLFGFGESQYKIVVENSAGLNHPHNAVLQIMLQWGAVGALCFFALAALIGWNFLRAVRATPTESAPALLVASALAAFALYEGTFYHPYPIAMLVLSLGYVLGRPAAQAGE